MKLNEAQSHLCIIDAQEKLFAAMSGTDKFERNAEILLAAAAEYQMPVTVSEQYPAGLGATLASIRKATDVPLEKMAFSWFGNQMLVDRLNAVGRSQLVLAGMETHVCVLQTALDAKAAGFDVFVIADAVLSRTEESRCYGLDRMARQKIEIVTTEMVAFEWMETAEAPAFRKMSRMIR